ncbi:MAG: hypothetical protein U1E27_07910, partial [Kiritimatiellia bacterium]|nr:hypothetical protein [Kiritimatiellia bacterium]
MKKNQIVRWVSVWASTLLVGTAMGQATNIWTGLGTTDNWSDVGNWSLGVAPNADNVVARFNTAPRTNIHVDVVGLKVNSLWFFAPSVNFSFSGNPIEIAGTNLSTEIRLNVPASAGSTITFNNNLVWTGTGGSTDNRAFAAQGTSKIILNGDFDFQQALYFGGRSGGEIIANGIVTNTVGTHGLTIHGGGTGTTVLNNDTNGFYRFIVSAQILIVDSLPAVQNVPSSLGRNVLVPNFGQIFGTSPSGTHWSQDISNLATLRYTGGAVTTAVPFALDGRYSGPAIGSAVTNRGTFVIEVSNAATTLSIATNIQYASDRYGGNLVLAGAGNGVLQGSILGAANGNIFSNFSGAVIANGARDSAHLWKTGAGTWEIQGTGKVSNLTVEGGKLLLNKTLTVMTNGIVPWGSAEAYVGVAGTLGGTGTLTVANGLLIDGGTLSPGHSIGTFNVIGNVAFDNLNEDPIFEVELALDETSDRLAVTGNLNLGFGTELSLLGFMKEDHWYTIATYSGTLTGTFASFDTSGLENLGSIQVDYGTGSNSSILVMIPEPGT